MDSCNEVRCICHVCWLIKPVPTVLQLLAVYSNVTMLCTTCTIQATLRCLLSPRLHMWCNPSPQVYRVSPGSQVHPLSDQEQARAASGAVAGAKHQVTGGGAGVTGLLARLAQQPPAAQVQQGASHAVAAHQQQFNLRVPACPYVLLPQHHITPACCPHPQLCPS